MISVHPASFSRDGSLSARGTKPVVAGASLPPRGDGVTLDGIEELPEGALLLRPQALQFPETTANALTIALSRRELFCLPFQQLHRVARAWQALKEEGRRRGYRCLESQDEGELAMLFFYRGN